MLNQDAKEILLAAVGISNALSDGVQLSDLGALMKLPAAVDDWKVGVVNLEETWEEASGRDEILQFIKDEFDIPDDVLEEKIEASMEWIKSTYGLYRTWSPKE